MINCLIVDDEPVALNILEAYVQRTPFLSLKGKCNGVNAALRHLADQQIDLLFLDIQMPQINGLEFTKTLSDDIKVIFTTAFEQYALEGFKVNALAYLLKPFNYQEFLEAAMRAKEWFDLKNTHVKSGKEDSMFVKSAYKLVKIDFKDILYIEGMKDYAKFYLINCEKPIFSLMSLKSLEEKLPEGGFMRVHRSYIVGLDNITAIARNEILFDNVSIPVAEKYRSRFQDFIKSR